MDHLESGRSEWKLWVILTVAIFLILIAELITLGFQQRDQSDLIKEQNEDTVAIIKTISHVNRYTFTEYLSGYWTSKQGLIKIDFLKLDTITMPNKPPVFVKIIAEDFSSGNLEFSIAGHPNKKGWVRKIWNSDAVSLKMPGMNLIYLYRYLPLQKSTDITVQSTKKK